MTTWTPELDAEIATLWLAGALSAETIGEKIGASKNAVLGRVHRLGLPPRKDGTAQAAGRERVKEAARGTERRRTNGCRWIESPNPVAEMRAGKAWDDLICGAEVDRVGGSFCAPHRARVWTKPAPRTKRPMSFTGAGFNGFGGE